MSGILTSPCSKDGVLRWDPKDPAVVKLYRRDGIWTISPFKIINEDDEECDSQRVLRRLEDTCVVMARKGGGEKKTTVLLIDPYFIEHTLFGELVVE
jgi:hypothetical protein